MMFTIKGPKIVASPNSVNIIVKLIFLKTAVSLCVLGKWLCEGRPMYRIESLLPFV